MQWRTSRPEPNSQRRDAEPDDDTDAVETPAEADENDLDESNLQDADDDRWDVFLLDDDGDPLPDYGDFWFPD